MEILNLIRDKICIDTYTYINEEDERLVNTFMCIYNRNIISEEEIINWIYSFKDIEDKGKEPNDEYLRQNIKLFLRSLYFRGKRVGINDELISTVIDVLNSLPAFY